MSALLDAKQATYDLLRAWPWPGNQPVVTWGPPTKTEDTNTWGGEHIYLGASSVEVPDEQLGFSGRRDDEFLIRVFVDVYQDGDDEQAAEVRADVLYDEVVKVFQRNHTLSGTVSYIQGFTSGRQLTPYAIGWLCQVSIEQSCVLAVTQVP